MTTLTIDRDRILTDLVAGDAITAVDDRPLGVARTVEVPDLLVGNDVHAVRLVAPAGSSVEWMLYPDSQVVTSITVERPDPAPSRPRRRVTRRFGRLVLVSRGEGTWASEDGRYVIQRDDEMLTYCEAPHPVRVTAEMARAAREHADQGWAQPILSAVRQGRHGYLCPGDEEHYYSAWAVWDNEIDDYALRDAHWHDSFTEAASWLARGLDLA